jgi:hypothetical protein
VAKKAKERATPLEESIAIALGAAAAGITGMSRTATPSAAARTARGDRKAIPGVIRRQRKPGLRRRFWKAYEEGDADTCRRLLEDKSIDVAEPEKLWTPLIQRILDRAVKSARLSIWRPCMRVALSLYIYIYVYPLKVGGIR